MMTLSRPLAGTQSGIRTAVPSLPVDPACVLPDGSSFAGLLAGEDGTGLAEDATDGVPVTDRSTLAPVPVVVPLAEHSDLPVLIPVSSAPLPVPGSSESVTDGLGLPFSRTRPVADGLAPLSAAALPLYPWHPAQQSSAAAQVRPLPVPADAADRTPRVVAQGLAPSLGADTKPDVALTGAVPLPLSPASAPALPQLSAQVAEEARAGWMVAVPPHKGLPEWAPVTLTPGKPEHWGEALRNALGERLQLQTAHGMDKALIRLDPPAMGALEIAIRHEAGVLSVQLTASNPDVVRQLQAMGEGLRQDLAQRQQAQVSVEVREGQAGSGQSQGRQEGQRRDERTPGKALYEADVTGEAFEAEPGLSRV
ncbi:flagellar hook-length control protein FliK [Craterilacuibacter sp.]|uniref:flagellar hook-length control protein FliK n=1 Tax=Craterilacuibacter sp. TaxID=2870909 RepID=UPI003F3B5E98